MRRQVGDIWTKKFVAKEIEFDTSVDQASKKLNANAGWTSQGSIAHNTTGRVNKDDWMHRRGRGAVRCFAGPW